MKSVGDIIKVKKFFGLITRWQVIEKVSDNYRRSAEFSDFDNAIIFSKLCQEFANSCSNKLGEKEK